MTFKLKDRILGFGTIETWQPCLNIFDQIFTKIFKLLTFK